MKTKPSKPPSLGPAVRGWVQLGVLWHLMQHGTAGKPQLRSWLGTDVRVIDRAVAVLLERGLLQATPNPIGHCRQVYGLSPAGIELALHITPEHWQGPGPVVKTDIRTYSQPPGATHGQFV